MARHNAEQKRLPERPSAGVLLEAVLAERQARLESIDAMTNRAGYLLGFTGTIVALTVLLDEWWLRLPVFIPATFAVRHGLAALQTVLLPGLNPESIRRKLLMQPPLGAQSRMLDYLTARHDQLVQTATNKAECLRKSSTWLVITIGALALAGLLEGVL